MCSIWLILPCFTMKQFYSMTTWHLYQSERSCTLQHCVTNPDQTCLLWVLVDHCIGKHHPGLNNHLILNSSWCYSNTIPIYPPDPTYAPPVISYHPSSSYICPSLYSDLIGPPTMIITHVCKVWPDHFKVNWVEGRFCVNEWVQDYSWRGPMVVVRFAAENRRELQPKPSTAFSKKEEDQPGRGLEKMR